MRFAACVFMFLLVNTVFIKGFAQSLDDSTRVLVLDENDKLPDGARLMDNIKVNGGFRGCGYGPTMIAAKKKARYAGGNIIKITELKCPDHWNSCFRLRADVYYADNIGGMITDKERALDSAIAGLLPDTASYALLYVYRPRGSAGALVSYNLHVEDSDVCRVSNGSKFAIKIYNKGETRIWARTESRKEINLYVKPGKVYFLRCFVRMGIVVGEPEFDLIDPYQAYYEFFSCPYDDDAQPDDKR